MTYFDRIFAYFRGFHVPEDVCRELASVLGDATHCCVDPDVDELNRLIFGERVECPKCGSAVLPAMICWGCEEWTAPEKEDL